MSWRDTGLQKIGAVRIRVCGRQSKFSVLPQVLSEYVIEI